MAATDPADGHLSCSICFTLFDGQQRRPWDIGCGHSYCEVCLRQHPRSFRYCPECRARASNPHVNIALLRLVDAQNAAARQRQPQGIQQHAFAQPSSNRSSMDTAAAAAATTAASRPSSLVLRQPHDLRMRAQGQNPNGSTAAVLQSLTATDIQGSLAAHQNKIAEWRTRMWMYLTPVLGFLYLISPLDIIPDFLPLIGWLDDFLVIMYIACSIFSMMGQQQQQQRNTMRL